MANILDEIARRTLSSRETVQASYDIARLAIRRHVPGDFVECGVFAGGQVAAMAWATMDCASQRVLHLFDSFSGVPAPGPEDIGWMHPEGLSACSVEQVKAHMEEWGIDSSMLRFHVGLFEDTIPCAKIEQIAVLRLDGDLHASTKVCLEHLYPRVSKGGWIIVDDFGLPGCRKAALEYMVNGWPPIYLQKH